MARDDRRNASRPAVFLLVAGQALRSLARQESTAPLGPLAEPEPMITSEKAAAPTYGPRAAARRPGTRGFFLDRYAC